MRGIYSGVKAGNKALARECFGVVANALQDRYRLDALILGCREIPLALDVEDLRIQIPLLDPAARLANELARGAYR